MNPRPREGVPLRNAAQSLPDRAVNGFANGHRNGNRAGKAPRGDHRPGDAAGGRPSLLSAAVWHRRRRPRGDRVGLQRRDVPAAGADLRRGRALPGSLGRSPRVAFGSTTPTPRDGSTWSASAASMRRSTWRQRSTAAPIPPAPSRSKTCTLVFVPRATPRHPRAATIRSQFETSSTSFASNCGQRDIATAIASLRDARGRICCTLLMLAREYGTLAWPTRCGSTIA